MIEKQSIPFAPLLIESMRSLGYSFESAVADLIDNSISARAKKIDIYMPPTENPYLIIFDDGCGMTNSELENAMRYGSSSPLLSRNDDDLGRFGLGLKAASLSQCRKLIVVSKKNHDLSCYSWDIDLITQKNDWVLLEYDDVEIKKLPRIDMFNNVESGTYVLLQNFDRVSLSTNNLKQTLVNYMSMTVDHISLVFHRFMEEGLEIYVNNEKVEPLDPFLRKNNATQAKKEQNFLINGEKIFVKSYVLPHINQLSLADIKLVGGKDDLRTKQGFYIYRKKRLIIWGTWFRLARKEELTKLARVMVDIPNSLDYMWNIDIKKSTANLPDIIKKQLYSCITESSDDSKKVFTYRGRTLRGKSDIDYVWDITGSNDEVKFRINRNIKQISMLCETLNSNQQKLLNNIFNNIEESLPFSDLYLSLNKGNVIKKKDVLNTDELYDEILDMIDLCKQINHDPKLVINEMMRTEPYCNDENLKRKVALRFDEQQIS